MALVVTDEGMRRIASLILYQWTTPRRVGLWSNLRDIFRDTTIADLVPCAFSGYDGLRPFPPTGVVTDPTPFAVAQASPILWSHNGGPVGEYVIGYYVVDQDGALLWAEARPEGPVRMSRLGDDYRVNPTHAVYTRYGGEV